MLVQCTYTFCNQKYYRKWSRAFFPTLPHYQWCEELVSEPGLRGWSHDSPEVLLKPRTRYLLSVMQVRVVEHLARGKLGDTCYGWERSTCACAHVYAVNALIDISPLLLTIAGKYSVNQVILLWFQLISEYDVPKKVDVRKLIDINCVEMIM